MSAKTGGAPPPSDEEFEGTKTATATAASAEAADSGGEHAADDATPAADSTYVRDDADADEEEDEPLLLDPSNKRASRAASVRRSRRKKPSPATARARQPKKLTPRSVLLSLSLSLILGVFWLIDSLKDPVFAALVRGDLQTHQPRAKLASVAGQIGLVWLMETILNERRRRRRKMAGDADGDARTADDAEVRDGGGRWTRMLVGADDGRESAGENPSERIPVSVFRSIGVPYSAAFALAALMLRKHPSFSSAAAVSPGASGETAWRILGYVLYLSIESFGSFSVAAFWSFANSTLSLKMAEAWYGTIVACAQLGAIGGSTVAAHHAHVPEGSTGGELEGVPRLFLLAVAGMGVQMGVMALYGHFFPHPMIEEEDETRTDASSHGGGGDGGSKLRKRVLFHRTLRPQRSNAQEQSGEATPTPKSGVYLILKHNYLLLILGVSCLYEISLTCLDYQMKLIGLDRFGGEEKGFATSSDGGGAAWALAATFSQFMGRFGQLTNALSLLLSYFAFPYLIRRYGLKRTLLLFPTLLVAVTLLTYLALPLNLPVLFVSMSLLKAMTYSVNDPAKEILYIPTSDDVKFRCKFWIDVVGARVAKAVGSSINTYAGSAERIIRYGSIPSVVTAGGLWMVCYRVGLEFNGLLSRGEIVGGDEDGGDGDGDVDPALYENVREGDEDFLSPSEDEDDGHAEDEADGEGVELITI